MKRVVALLLALSICISLCACGKSEAVKAVEDQIATLNTPVSYDLLGKTITSYNALSEEEKQQVENYNILEEYSLEYAASELKDLSKLCISSMKLLASAWSTSIDLHLEGRLNPFADTLMERACVVSREKLLNAMVKCNMIDTADEMENLDTISYHLQNPDSVIRIVGSLLKTDGVFDTLLTETIHLQEVISCLDEKSKDYDTVVEYYADVCAMYEYLLHPTGSLANLGDMIEEYSKGISAYNAKLSIT